MNPNTNNLSNKPTEDKLSKKAYRSPKLVAYGTISEITRTVDNMGMMDGGSGMFDKT